MCPLGWFLQKIGCEGRSRGPCSADAGVAVIFTAKNFSPSFETKKKSMSFAIARNLADEIWQQVFLTIEENRSSDNIFYLCKELHSFY